MAAPHGPRAENLFLRKQLALFRQREKKAMPTTPADRFVFSNLARWFDWRSALLIVKPAVIVTLRAEHLILAVGVVPV